MLHQAGIGVVGPVFRAHDPAGDRLVAIKAITLDLLPEVAAELTIALRRLSAIRLDHPAIVPIFDAGREGGRPYVVADYVAGESLDIARRHLAPAPFEMALRLLHDIAGAIDAAWSAGIGHGALHPRDIFIVPAQPAVRVTGFGIAQALERVGIHAPLRRPYTAPERADRRSWDIRADVYSLGAIAQELLAGRRPAGAGDQDGVLSALPADQAAQVRQVLARALSADPAQRFGSAAAFVGALTAVAGGERAEAAEPVPDAAANLPAPVSDSLHVASPPAVPVDGFDAKDRGPSTDETPSPIDSLSLRPAVVAPASVDLSAASHDTFSPAARPPVRPRRRDAYPWGAIAAVAIACLALGGVIGYSVARGLPTPAPGPSGAQQSRPAVDTEVAVAADPPARPAPAAPDVRPASRTTSVGPGRIVVRSVPAGALVTVDGRHAGETPITVPDLALGAHTVVVARPGYVPRAERIVLSRRDVVRQLTVELRPGMDLRSAQLGSIYVDTRPRGARVLIDGRFVGTTPMSLAEVLAGEHRVQVELEGHVSQASTVTVRAGEQVRVALTLGREARR